MKELIKLSVALKSLGYIEISNSLLKFAEQTTQNKPIKIMVSSKPMPNNQGYILSVTPIMPGGKSGAVETIEFPTLNSPVKPLPDKKFEKVVDKLFGPGTRLTTSMIDLKLSPGQTGENFGIVIK